MTWTYSSGKANSAQPVCILSVGLNLFWVFHVNEIIQLVVLAFSPILLCRYGTFIYPFITLGGFRLFLLWSLWIVLPWTVAWQFMLISQEIWGSVNNHLRNDQTCFQSGYTIYVCASMWETADSPTSWPTAVLIWHCGAALRCEALLTVAFICVSWWLVTYICLLFFFLFCTCAWEKCLLRALPYQIGCLCIVKFFLRYRCKLSRYLSS